MKRTLLPVLVSLAIGFFGVTIQSAYSAVSTSGAASPAQAFQPASLDAIRAAARSEAQAACDVLLSYKRVTECKVVEWNPSIDFVIDARRPEAIAICGRAVKILADKVPQVTGKGWSLRVLAPATLLPTDSCSLI